MGLGANKLNIRVSPVIAMPLKADFAKGRCRKAKGFREA